MSQNVDLGDLSAACLTNPSSCGSGGSLSFWFKTNEHGKLQIIGTTPANAVGFGIWFNNNWPRKMM